MSWVICNTSRQPMFYCFDVSAVDAGWSLAAINSATYDNGGAVLLTPATLAELSACGTPIFETKAAAKQAFKRLGIATCRYVQIRLGVAASA